MRKTYTPQEILEMAVKNAGVDPNADLNGDARITAADARLALHSQKQTADAVPDSGAKQKASAGAAPGTRAAYDYAPDEKTAGMKETLLSQLAAQSAEGLQVNADLLYDQYRRRYARSAALAADNVYGLAARSTGGYGNSWAASAAAAAYDQVMEGLADRGAEIDRLALNARQSAFENLQNAYTAVKNAEQQDYDRYQDRLSLAFKAAGQGDYGLLEDMDIGTAALRRKDISDLAAFAASYGDNRFLNAMGVDTSAKNAAEAMEQAVTAAKYGDYTRLQALGVDTSAMQYNELLRTAATLADYGDLSGLEALGVDVSALREKNLLERATALAKYGDYSLLGSLSGNLANLKQKVSVTVQKGAESAYAYGGYAALVKYLNKQVGYGQLTEAGKKQILTVLTGGGHGA